MHGHAAACRVLIEQRAHVSARDKVIMGMGGLMGAWEGGDGTVG